MNRFLKHILMTTTSLLGMQPFDYYLASVFFSIELFDGHLACSFKDIKRTRQEAVPALIFYNATLNDGTQIMAYLHADSSLKGHGNLRYKAPHETIMHYADSAFLKRLYPSYQSDAKPHIREQLYKHLLKTLDNEFVKQHPGQKRILLP